MPDSPPFSTTVTRESARAFARRRAWLAISSAPALLSLAAGVVMFDARLTLLAVIAGVFAYALVSVARRQLGAPADASPVIVDAGHLSVRGQDRGVALAAIRRRDYVRVLFKPGPIHRLWLDNRRDPTAFVDLPLPRPDDARLCEALASAGAAVSTESMAGRVVGLLPSTGVGIAGLALVKASMGLAAVTATGGLAPLGWAGLGLGAVLVAALWVASRTA